MSTTAVPFDLAPQDADLAPTRFVDSDHPDVVARAVAVTDGLPTARERAVALFEAVRDGIRYDPYSLSRDPDDFRASAVLAGSQRWCAPKAVVLVAQARAVGIPARLGFADVRNHLQSAKLAERMGTDVFAWHGYAVMWLEGAWRKASPAFNRELCERFGTKILEFDGRSDALLHAVDKSGRRHMEYVRDRGIHRDLPLDEVFATFAAAYPAVSTPGPVHDDLFHGT